ncbi:MAG: hypothetical protein KGJ40_09325 [candidate division NC10 bacterium]|nr:hypothetical protein [candidate division NC10 bacterium]MDE2484988.1 hypothetical protein [candidate division NC10 bacterium]
MKKMLKLFSGVSILALSAGLACAADDKPAQSEAKPGEAVKAESQQERVRGSQLMTEEERAEHRKKMRAAKTAEERQQIRKEFHEQMKARAKERGVTLPDEPPAMGGGMGPGGMGPGPRR